MKYYFLGLSAIVAVCVGCQSTGFDRASAQRGSPGLPGREVLAARGNDDAGQYFAPPAVMMMRPGPMVDGPGPGVLNPIGMDGAMAAGHKTTQVKFVEPLGMSIGWQIGTGFAEAQLSSPGRYNFQQAASYRLKLTGIPGRDGLTLYPTLQVYPAHPQTDAFLAHNAVPVQITEEDLDQVQANNFVTKVIYLPSPQHQELAIAGVEQLVSTRLDPGLDPVAEADRRGTILLVLRLGNMDMESPDSNATVAADGSIQPASHVQRVNGEAGQFAAPVPIEGIGARGHSIPPAMMMGAPAAPGQASYNPVTGQMPAPLWGMPITGTPIGLAGPPHLPLGGPAGLRQHTVRNKSRNQIPRPTDKLLIDVKHKPGIVLPEPVRHVKYTEKQPVIRHW